MLNDNILPDYFMSVGWGQVPNHTRMTALGNNPDVDTSTTPEDIAGSGGLLLWPSSTISLELLSSSPNDTAAGSGARSVTVVGLDSAYNSLSETVIMNGTLAVPLVNQLRRINALVVATAGIGEVNDGAITLRAAGAGSTYASIAANIGGATRAVFSVPAGYTLQIPSAFMCINKQPGAITVASTCAVMMRSFAGVTRQTLTVSFTNLNPYRHDGLPGIIVNEKSDVWIRCLYVSENNLDITAAMLGVVKKNGAP